MVNDGCRRISSPAFMGLRTHSLLFLLLSPLACTKDSDDATGASGSSGASSSSDASGSSGDGSAGVTGETGGAGVVVSGDAFAFTLPGTPYGLIAGATLHVLEAPEFTVMTDAQGHFEFPALPPGSAATFVLEHPNHPPARTKTFTLADAGELTRVTFQVPDNALYGAIAGILEVELDPGACQIVTTVTRVGKSIYDAGAHGEAGATVTIAPAVPAEQGPIYFGDDVIPNRTLTETSTDGGVLFVNVPPGTYELQAHKDGVTFESATMKCEAGVLVNASPPYGLQALP
jgi:hypothetical protein